MLLRGTHVFRTVRLVAAASITLWAAGAAAEGTAPATGAASDASPAAPAAPATPVSPPVPPPQITAPAQPAAAPPVPATGTPATVLDTQDYEGVLGKAVRSSTGEDMGRIIDIILDKDGRPRAAIIDFGGFLGVGSRKIAVDWRAMRFSPDGKPSRLVLQLSRNQVRVSPEYKPGDPIVVLGPASPERSARRRRGGRPSRSARLRWPLHKSLPRKFRQRKARQRQSRQRSSLRFSPPPHRLRRLRSRLPSRRRRLLRPLPCQTSAAEKSPGK